MAVELNALDARNPVAFLAALGALRLAGEEIEPKRTLHWIKREGVWTAISGGTRIDDREELVDAIVRGHQARDLDRELGWDRDVMKLTRDQVRNLLVTRLRDGGPESWAAATVAATVAELPERRSGDAPYTPFRLIPRVGRARFLETARRLSEPRDVTGDIRTALFGPWRYSKANNLAWDPGARLPARAYAAEAPTHFGPLAVPGAMLLAIAALPLFPLMPGRKSVLCRGFGETGGRRLTWPVWTQAMTLRAVRVLLGVPALYAAVPDTRVLARHGIVARMSASRARLGPDSWVLGWGQQNVSTLAS